MKLVALLIGLFLAAAASAHEVSRTDAACGEFRGSIHACVDARGVARITGPHAPCKRTDIRALHWQPGGPVFVFWKKDGGFEK